MYEFPALALSITLLNACIIKVSFHCKINYCQNVPNISLHSENRQYREVALWTMTHCPFTVHFLCIFTNCCHKKVNFFLIHALLAQTNFNPLNAELNPICYLLALLAAHHFLHVSRIRVKSLTFRLLMPYIYIYMEQIFLMFLDHTQWRSTVGRTPLDEWSARRRDLYLTTHDTHNRKISMPTVGFETKISAGEWQGRSPAEILGSNPTGGMDICLLWVSCVVR